MVIDFLFGIALGACAGICVGLLFCVSYYKGRENERERIANSSDSWIYKLCKLSEADVWAVLTALRACDDQHRDNQEDRRFKELTTGRVRAILGVGGDFVIKKESLTKNDVQERNRLLNEHLDHFYTHFEHAMFALRRLGYDVPESELEFGVVEKEGKEE